MTRRPSAFPRKPGSVRPKKPVRSKSSYPALDFAISYKMLSDEEINNCQNGLLTIKGHVLTSEFGQESTLYLGRKYDLLADKLLGLDETED